MEKAKVEMALRKARAAHAKLGEELGALEALINDDPTPGQTAREMVGTFGAKWQLRYRQQYVVPNWAQATLGLKRLLAKLAPADVEQRIVAYLKSNEAFYVDARHPLPMFLAAVNKFAPVADDEHFLRAPVADCQHQPPCADDQVHTRRRAQEARQ